MGLFTVGVPKRGKRIHGLLWGYFLQITFTWNKFKWDVHSFGGGEFFTIIHLKLDILNPLNTICLSNGLKKKSFSLQPFLSKFKDFEFFV
jgi:hypothetical protein